MRSHIPLFGIVCVAFASAGGIGAAHASPVTLDAAVTVTSVYDLGTKVTTVLPNPIVFNLSITFDDGVTNVSTRVGPPSWTTDVTWGDPTGLESIPLTVPPPPGGWTSVFGGSITLEEREFRTDSRAYFQLYDAVDDQRVYNYPSGSPHQSYLYWTSLSSSVRDAGYTSPDFGVPTIGSFLSAMTQGGTFRLVGSLRERDGSTSGLRYDGTFEATATRVPEPAGVLLLAVGLGFCAKRRRGSHSL